MNIFQCSNSHQRLTQWIELRESIQSLSLKEMCIEVDKWWQMVPIINHHLHPDDISNWPNPWDLLNDNVYCYYARALEMVYTLKLSGVKEISLVDAVDASGDEVVLVIVGKEYVLNYWPNTVVSNKSKDFVIKRNLNISSLLQRY